MVFATVFTHYRDIFSVFFPINSAASRLCDLIGRTDIDIRAAM